MPYICSHTKLAFQVRYFIEIAYKGTNFHGWQYQPNAITVQELINKALSIIFKKSIDVVGAGRTDAGVHAEQLFAHLDLEEDFNIDEVLKEFVKNYNNILESNSQKVFEDYISKSIVIGKKITYKNEGYVISDIEQNGTIIICNDLDEKRVAFSEISLKELY